MSVSNPIVIQNINQADPDQIAAIVSTQIAQDAPINLPDGIYTVGLGVGADASITVVNHRITAIQQATP